jgi:hypothetical protein
VDDLPREEARGVRFLPTYNGRIKGTNPAIYLGTNTGHVDLALVVPNVAIP